MQTRSLSGEVIGAAVVVDGAAGIGDGAAASAAGTWRATAL